MTNSTRREWVALLAVLAAGKSFPSSLAFAQEPALPRSEQRQLSPKLATKMAERQPRPWVISSRMLSLLKIERANQEKFVALTVLGEDGNRYSIDEVLYGILAVLEAHVFPEARK